MLLRRVELGRAQRDEVLEVHNGARNAQGDRVAHDDAAEGVPVARVGPEERAHEPHPQPRAIGATHQRNCSAGEVKRSSGAIVVC